MGADYISTIMNITLTKLLKLLMKYECFLTAYRCFLIKRVAMNSFIIVIKLVVYTCIM